MSGDYSRQRFDARRDFSGVLMQQGRVQLDADWNEQVQISDRRWRAATTDTIGRCVVPKETPDGFSIGLAGGKFTIGRGRIYVDGLLTENHGDGILEFDATLAEQRGEDPLAFDKQPFYPQPDKLPTAGTHLAYVDVWQREVTFLEAPDLVETAVGVDTTARLQTVWQVRLLLQDSDQAACSTPDDKLTGWLDVIRPSAGRLSTKLEDVPAEQGPCLLPPTVGFRGLENRLYRVEIHDGGKTNAATFKWSRDNGSVVAAVTGMPLLDTLVIDRTGRDETLRFNPGDWIEITSDVREFTGQAGVMCKIANVDPPSGTLTLTSQLTAGTFPTDAALLQAQHTRIRRWDQSGPEVDAGGGLLKVPSAGTAVSLEDGIQVTFSTTPAGGNLRVGDYWSFAARTADASVESLDHAPPRGIHHHYGRLAIVTFPGTVSDCRVLWPPSHLALRYVGGDGQEASPGESLSCPLSVGVEDEHGRPVTGIPVHFRDDGSGDILTEVGNPANTGSSVVVSSNAAGLSQVNRTLSEKPGCHDVEAALESPPQGAALTIRFEATARKEDEIESIRVTDVLLLRNGQSLRNDDLISIDQLLGGIAAVTTDEVDPNSAKRPTCFVTVEDPRIINQVYDVSGQPAAYLPLVLAARVVCKDNAILWLPEKQVSTLVERWKRLQINEPLLARLTLKGSFIWAVRSEQSPTFRHLDGDTFGVPAKDGHLSPEGLRATDEVLPSGDGRRGGDFPIWFWLGFDSIVVKPSDRLDFGTVALGVNGNRSVTLGNVGDAPVTMGVAVTGDAFSAATPDPAIKVEPGGQASIPLVFNPPKVGTFTGQLTITGDQLPGGKAAVALQGSGSLLRVDRWDLPFGELLRDMSKERTLTVHNPSHKAVKVSGIASDLDGVVANPKAFTLKPGESREIKVSFKPQVAGQQSGWLHIDSSAGQLDLPLSALVRRA